MPKRKSCSPSEGHGEPCVFPLEGLGVQDCSQTGKEGGYSTGQTKLGDAKAMASFRQKIIPTSWWFKVGSFGSWLKQTLWSLSIIKCYPHASCLQHIKPALLDRSDTVVKSTVFPCNWSLQLKIVIHNCCKNRLLPFWIGQYHPHLRTNRHSITMYSC